MRKKVKKVIKGLEKASKTHAKQAKILKSGLKVFKARGGMDMGAGSSGMGAGKSGSNFGDSGAVDTGDLGTEAANVAANISATSHGGGGNRPSSPSGVTVKKGPVQLPNIGLTSLIFNQISKGLYDAKNVKEQKKVDALGGEMLTQGKRGPKNTGNRGDGGREPTAPIKKPTLMAQTQKVPMPIQKVKPKMFEFNFNEGGLVRVVGKILKDRKRKVRIF